MNAAKCLFSFLLCFLVSSVSAEEYSVSDEVLFEEVVNSLGQTNEEPSLFCLMGIRCSGEIKCKYSVKGGRADLIVMNRTKACSPNGNSCEVACDLEIEVLSLSPAGIEVKNVYVLQSTDGGSCTTKCKDKAEADQSER